MALVTVKLASAKRRMPAGPGTKGNKLWSGVVHSFDLTTADPDKARILYDACRTADLVKRLDDAAAKAPLTVNGLIVNR